MALRIEQLATLLRSFRDDVLLYRNAPPEQARLIDEGARQQSIRMTRPLIIVALVVGVAWWPTDFLLYGDRPEVVGAFAVWRSAVMLASTLLLVGYARSESARRFPTLVATIAGSCMTLAIGYSLGSLGSLEQPWFASLYLAPLMGFPFLIPFRVRLAGTLCIAVAGLFGFFILNPDNLAHPDVATAVGLMVFSIAIALSAGHANYHQFRQNLLQSLQLAERTRELEVLSGSLQERVEARTTELRLLAAHVELLRERERGAIARELHDELGQLLTGMRIELEVAERLRTRGGDAGPRYVRLLELLDATLDSTRSMLSHLRPRILDDFGLVASLEWLVSDTKRRAGLDVRFRADPAEFEVPDDVATAVFRIVQESLTNVLKHAGASVVHVGLVRSGDALTATVTDDGVGLPAPESRRPVSLGLLGMRERALAFGGSLEFATPAAGGTAVSLRLPWPPRADPAATLEAL